MKTRSAPPKPPGGVRRQQKEKTRQALLEAARVVGKRRGFAKTTTREIAEAAGVAVGTVFLHFPDVAALAEALLDEQIGVALDEALRTLPRRGDVVRRLVHVSKKLYESYDVEPDLSRQYLAASLFHSNPDGPATARIVQFRGWVTAQIAEAASQGEIPEIDPDFAFMAFFTLYFGVLVGGLRGLLDRKRQLALLDASLRQFLKTEVHA